MSVRRADRKRILVLSASFGGPHSAVADSVVRYFRTHHAACVDVRQIDFLERFMPNINVLAKFGYQQSVRFFPSGTGDLARVMASQPDNAVATELASGVLEQVVSSLSEYGADAVVSVLPVAAAVASEAAGQVGFFSASVNTDFTARGVWVHPATDAYFVAAREVRDELVVAGVEWDRITVSGLPALDAPADTPGRALRRKGLGLADRFTCVVVASSGAGAEVAEIASRVAASGIQVAVPLDSAPRLARAIVAVAKKTDLVLPIGRDKPAESLLGVADVVVCRAGGASPIAAISLGTPLILYNPIPGQERYNVDFLVNSGAALIARDEEDVAEKVRFLSTHPKRLRQMVTDSAALSRADAAETICERVLACIG